MNTKIYGASDDLIEIEGDISGEIYHYDDKTEFICSDGTKGRITYDWDWFIDVIEEGLGFVKLVRGQDEIPHTDTDAIGCTSYSDVLILKDIEWIKMKGKKYK